MTRLFLGDPEFAPYGQLFFPAASASPAFGAALFGLLSDPNPLLRIGSRHAARDFITEIAGRPAEDLLAHLPSANFAHSTYGHVGQVQSSVA